MKPNAYLFCVSILLSNLSLAANQELKISYKQPFKQLDLLTSASFKQQGSHLNYRHFDIGIRKPFPYLGDGWSYDIHFRQTHTHKKPGKRSVEKRTYLQLKKKFSSKKISFLPSLDWQIRGRQELRFRQQIGRSWRSRLKLSAKKKHALFNSHPFISYEYYYDYLNHDITKKSAEAGLQFSKYRALTPSIYLKHSSSYKKQKWHSYSGVVFKLAF